MADAGQIIKGSSDRRKLYPRIANASLDRPEDFAKSVLETILDVFPLRGASLYAYSPRHQALILRGQRGFKYNLYRSFTVPIATPAGDAISFGETKTFTDVAADPRYIDTALINTFGLKSLVAVPLIASADVNAEHPTPLGVI